MKTIKYIDEEGLKEIFKIFNKTKDGIVAVLGKMNERFDAMDETIKDLTQSTTDIRSSLNTMKDELSALNFDMGSYSESE